MILDQEYRTVVAVDAVTDLSSQYVLGVFGITEMQKIEEDGDDDEVMFAEPVIPRKCKTMWD